MRIAILLNAGAGTAARHRSDELCGRIAESCAALGLAADVRSVAAPDMRDAVAAAAADRAVEAVVVGGGDGTLNTAVNVLVHAGKPMGVLPLGTLNHFARDLGIPADLYLRVMISFGFPLEAAKLTLAPRKGGRRGFEDVVHIERW